MLGNLEPLVVHLTYGVLKDAANKAICSGCVRALAIHGGVLEILRGISASEPPSSHYAYLRMFSLSFRYELFCSAPNHRNLESIVL